MGEKIPAANDGSNYYVAAARSREQIFENLPKFEFISATSATSANAPFVFTTISPPIGNPLLTNTSGSWTTPNWVITNDEGWMSDPPEHAFMPNVYGYCAGCVVTLYAKDAASHPSFIQEEPDIEDWRQQLAS